MSKKSYSNSDPSPQRPFGPLGTLVIGAFIFFFMLLPGGLITFHAVMDFLQQLSRSAALPALNRHADGDTTRLSTVPDRMLPAVENHPTLTRFIRDFLNHHLVVSSPCMTESTHQIRLDQILDRLETRSRQCPGMFPLTVRKEWHQLALQHEPAPEKSPEQLWRTLETFDRSPELAHQALNHLLAQQTPVSLVSVNEDPKQAARERRETIAALLDPEHLSYNKKHG